jgi:hypothetical protein
MSVPFGDDVGEDHVADGGRCPGGADDDAGHPGEAPDDGVLDQEDRADDVVDAQLHVRLPKRQQRAAEGRDRRGYRERVHLGPDDAHAQRRRGPLVAANREQPSTGTPTPHVGDEQPDQHEVPEHERAVALRVVQWVEVHPEE